MKGTHLLWAALAGLKTTVNAQFSLIVDPKGNPGSRGSLTSVPIDISSLRNNRGFAADINDANFDGTGSGYPAQYLPASDLIYGGVDFIFPQYSQTGYDNVLAQGQSLNVSSGRYSGMHMLAAAESAIATGFVNATYANGSATSDPVLVDPWWDWPYPYGGSIIMPFYYGNASIDYNRSMIFRIEVWLDSTKDLVSLQLPNVTNGASSQPLGESEDTRLHIFAVTMLPASADGGSGLDVQLARSTNTWVEGTNKTQIYEATINNVGDAWILANQTVTLAIESDGVRTVEPGYIRRLRPGDQARVQIGVVNADGVAEGTSGTATLVISGKGLANTTFSFNATYGVQTYEPTYESIYEHEAPPWYNNAKYGIFIHWGVYAVPGWGNVGDKEDYAEWYWWYQQQPNATVGTYEYALETYGPNVVYDDFIANFTASAFDAKEWVDLFNAAGAKYFVQVSKHHDGYAIFDIPSNISNRTSVALPPYRNLLQEIFDAAIEYQPHLRRGTYFSLPEWFHPDYKSLGFNLWPGGNATNPYTNETLPYTGYVHVDDYVNDLQLPEMQSLAAMGTEIMWCDIGGPNASATFASGFFNDAARQGRQVVMDNRCGLAGDFDTPEYARYDSIPVRKWESSLGMDPYSYGYNRATPDDEYITPSGIVTSLVDIVSKNGNFLLDIGPQANGTIIEIEQRNLRAAGVWINSHAEAIFNTTYWAVTPEEGQAVRFTQTPDAFYIITLYAPNDTLVLDSPVPYVAGLDEIVVVGGNTSGTVVPSELLSNGSLQLNISQDIRDADEYSWVFKIAYDNSSASGSGSGSNSGSGVTTSGGMTNRVETRWFSGTLFKVTVMVGCLLIDMLHV